MQLVRLQRCDTPLAIWEYTPSDIAFFLQSSRFFLMSYPCLMLSPNLMQMFRISSVCDLCSSNLSYFSCYFDFVGNVSSASFCLLGEVGIVLKVLVFLTTIFGDSSHCLMTELWKFYKRLNNFYSKDFSTTIPCRRWITSENIASSF